jgi:AmmeMemoRadiSam system protein B
MYKRDASHAGSWYEGRESALRSQIEGWLDEAYQNTERAGNVKAVIVPHAGYRCRLKLPL